MLISELLAPSEVLLDLRAPDKTALLQAIARRAAEVLGLPAEAVLDGITRREGLGSTGMGEGIAVPHARLPDVRAPYGLLARLRSPVDFEAVDERPVDIVFLLLLPADREAEPLNALACVARRLRDPAVAQAVRRASKAVDLYAAVGEAEAVSRAATPT